MCQFALHDHQHIVQKVPVHYTVDKKQQNLIESLSAYKVLVIEKRRRKNIYTLQHSNSYLVHQFVNFI